MKTICKLFCLLAILSAWAASPAIAKNDPLEFIHLMQREGFADVAIDYLNQLKTDPDTPKDVKDVWDLEMAKCKKQAAAEGQAYTAAQAKHWVDESKALLDKFVKANPDRPEAIQEAAKWLEDKATEAQIDVQKAAFSTDPAEKKKLLADARTIFEEIRPKFAVALKASIKLRDSFPARPLRADQARSHQEKRAYAKFLVGENRLTVAMVDFYLAYTLDASQRAEALPKCTKAFDDIYQDFRAAVFVREAFLGWRAHFWHARILQELGQTEDAKDIFEEVAAGDGRNIEDVDEAQNRTLAKVKATRKTGFEDFFADVEQYYLRTLFTLRPKDYLEEVRTWREAHKLNSKNCTGYQALTMDYIKHCLEWSKTAKDPSPYKKAALTLLGEMANISGPYQEGAIKLRRELDPNAAAAEGYEYAIVDGDDAAGKQKWSEAIEFYEKALAAAGPKPDKDRLASMARVRDAIVRCCWHLSAQLYHDGKVDEAIAAAKKALTPEFLKTETAPALAAYLLNVVTFRFQSAPEKTEEEKKAKEELRSTLTKVAGAIIISWPAKEEADAARVVLMRLAQAQGNFAEADRILHEIHPDSKEYPNALTEIGYAHWSKYTAAKGETETDKVAKRDADRKQAFDFIDSAVKALEKRRVPDAPMPEALRKAQMLLAEIYSEGGSFKQAAALYKPLIDDFGKDGAPGAPGFDDVALRIFYRAGPAFLKAGDMESAASLASKFVASGPDQPQINDAILGFAMILEQARKDALVEGESTDASIQAAAAAKVKTLTDLEEKTLLALSNRKNLVCRAMVSIVRTSSNLGTEVGNKTAADLIEKIDDRALNDPDFEKALGKSAVSLHALGAKLQADLGNYPKASEEIKAVLVKYPNALDPMVSEAKIYTAWAGKDSTKYDDAIAKWDNLRKLLEKKRPGGNPARQIDPKYDVLVNEADCFFRKYQKTKSKEDLKTGIDLLLPYLNLDPNIRTPGDEYKEISVRFYQVAGKLADDLHVQRPARPKVKPAGKAK